MAKLSEIDLNQVQRIIKSEERKLKNQPNSKELVLKLSKRYSAESKTIPLIRIDIDCLLKIKI